VGKIPQSQMNVFVDTNVVLDNLLERQPFYKDAYAIYQLVDQKKINVYMSAVSMTNIFYIVHKEKRDLELVYRMLDKLTVLFSIAPVSEKTIADALALRWKDFEDAVQYITATESGVDCIVTRNTADFKTSAIPCMSPVDFITYFSDRKTT